MWISFWVYHMLKCNDLCVKLAWVLSTCSPYLTRESAKAELLPSIICPSTLCFLRSTMTPRPLWKDTGHMNKRDFLWDTQWKQTPSKHRLFFHCTDYQTKKSQTNVLDGTSLSLWATGKEKDKLYLPCLPCFLNADITYVSPLTTI